LSFQSLVKLLVHRSQLFFAGRPVTPEAWHL